MAPRVIHRDAVQCHVALIAARTVDRSISGVDSRIDIGTVAGVEDSGLKA